MNNSGYTVVKINDEEIGLHFGIPANRMFYEKVAVDENMISGSIINEIGIATILHCGYINNCMIKDLPQDKTFGYFLSFVELGYVDTEIKKELERISKVFADSRFTKSVTERVANQLEDSKKKSKKKLTGI